MRVAVTGATGNVGTSLLDRLATEDRVTSIVALARRHPDPKLDASPAKVTWISADVVDDDLLPHLEGADVLVHLVVVPRPLFRTGLAAAWRAFLFFLKLIDLHVPKNLDVHLVLDNLNTHSHEKFTKGLAHPMRHRFHFVLHAELPNGLVNEPESNSVRPGTRLLSNAVRTSPTRPARSSRRWRSDLMAQSGGQGSILRPRPRCPSSSLTG